MTSKEIFKYSAAGHSPAELLDHECYSHTRVMDRWTEADPQIVTVYFRSQSLRHSLFLIEVEY